jgi:hypothetical protein
MTLRPKGEGYQAFCNNSIKALLLKIVKMGGGGVKNYQKLRDVIYGRPLIIINLTVNLCNNRSLFLMSKEAKFTLSLQLLMYLTLVQRWLGCTILLRYHEMGQKQTKRYWRQFKAYYNLCIVATCQSRYLVVMLKHY